MEISALSNTYLTQTRLAAENQQSKLNGFQSALDRALAKNDDKELKEACKEFESYFIYTMFKEMRKTIDKSGSMLNSQTEDTFQDLLDEEYGKSLANAGGIGLADMMFKQMKLSQE